MYEDYWDGVIEEGIQLGHSPELTALMIAAIFYQDMINNEATYEDLEKMRKCIHEKIDEGNRPLIMSKIVFTTLVATGWADHEVDGDKVAQPLGDIYSTILNDDEVVMDAFENFVGEAN